MTELNQLTHSYWQSNGKYQELADKLAKLIPSLGACDNDALELMRVVSNLYYDLYNNGLCNADHRLPPVQDMMRKYKQQLLAYMTQEQYERVYGCWEERHYDEEDDEGFIWSVAGGDYYPDYDHEAGWFTLELEQAFEALADASVLIAAKELGLSSVDIGQIND